MLLMRLILAVMFLSPALSRAALTDNDSPYNMPPSEADLIPEAVPSSSIFNMVASIGLEGENTVEIWESGRLFHPEYQGFIFKSIEVSAQQYDIESYDYLAELCQNLNNSGLTINGVSTPLDASVVTLFNLDYYNLNFYKGIYIPVEEGIFIFPALVDSNAEDGFVRLMVGFSASAREEEDVTAALESNIENILSSVRKALENLDFSIEEDSLNELEDLAVRQYYTHIKSIWDESGISHSDSLVELSILRSLSQVSSKGSLTLKELCSAFDQDVDINFTRYKPIHGYSITFDEYIDLSNLTAIDFSIGINYGLLKELDSIAVSFKDNGGEEAVLSIPRDGFVIKEPEEGVSPILAQIVFDYAGSKIDDLNSNQSLNAQERIDGIVGHLSSLDIDAIIEEEYSWMAGMVETGGLSRDDILSVIGVYGEDIDESESRGKLYFKITQDDIDNTMLSLSPQGTLDFSNFDLPENFNKAQVQKAIISFKSSRKIKLNGKAIIDSFDVSLEPDPLRNIRLYQYKDAVLEPLMRFFADFNPLTDAQDDISLTEMVLLAIRGEETFLEMQSRVFWHMENVIFLSNRERLGGIHNNVDYDMRRVEAFEQLLVIEGGDWMNMFEDYEGLEGLREYIWSEYGERIKDL